MEFNDIREIITRRRNQILVHSAIYYKYNQNVISDLQFDKWCNELVDLQQKYPNEASLCVHHDCFKDFDGSSGFDLDYHTPQILNAAHRVMYLHKKMKEEGTL